MQQEKDLIRRIKALEPDIGREGVQDMLAKIKAILLIVPKPRLSVVNSRFDLIGVSDAQLDPFFPEGLPLDNTCKHCTFDRCKCFCAYNGFQHACRWCTAAQTLEKDVPTITTGVVTPEHRDRSKPPPDLIVSDIIAIPCGVRRGGGTSHCIEIVFLVTERERGEMEREFRLHRFTRTLFARLQESIPVHNLHCLLLFGCLYAPGERVRKSHLYLLPDRDPLGGISTRSLFIERTEGSDGLWREIVDPAKQFKIDSTIKRMKIHPREEPMRLGQFGLRRDDFEVLQDGKVVRFHLCQRAAAMVQGIPKHDLPHFLLVIDKAGTEEFVSFQEMASLSDYATFCRHTLLNRRWYQERTMMAEEFNRVVELSNPPLRDAYVASMIISATHTAAHEWRSNFTTSAGILIDRVPRETLATKDIRPVRASYEASEEALSEFFLRMDKWRAMSTVKLRPVPVMEAIKRVFARFRTRLAKAAVEVDMPKGVDNIRVDADPTYLHEVLENLVQNAYDSLVGGPSPRITVSVQKTSQGKARICVEDNGPGFDQSQKDVIWTPGYTTKDHGTGQGLPFVQYAAKVAFQGRTECYSLPGRRTGFVLYLNLSQEE